MIDSIFYLAVAKSAHIKGVKTVTLINAVTSQYRDLHRGHDVVFRATRSLVPRMKRQEGIFSRCECDCQSISISPVIDM